MDYIRKNYGMKLRFIFTTIFLLFARGCDFYSTRLWFVDNPQGEMNPLARWFGVGWNGLVITNIFIISLTIYAYYYYTFKYSSNRVKTDSKQIFDFVSEKFFNEKGRFFDVFYKVPKNRDVLLAHTGYIMVRVFIFGSILATIHNLCQFYNVQIYNSFKEFVGRPLYVIYGLIFSSFIFFAFQLWIREFKQSQTN